MQVHVEFRQSESETVLRGSHWMKAAVQSGRTSLIQVDMAAASLILDVNRGRC
jgi:hypothetical protein